MSNDFENSSITPEYFINRVEWDVVVIIPTLYRTKYLKEVLSSLVKQSVLPKEVIIIEQSDETDIDIGMYSEFLDRLPLRLFHLKRRSKPVALNWSIRFSKSPIVLSIDDDTEFGQDLIFNHLRAMLEHHVDCISGAVVHRKNSALLDTYRIPPEWENGVYTIGHNPMVTYSCMTMGLAGCNFSIKRTALERVKGWDENMALLDDRDLALYLFKGGLKMHFDPRPKVIHLKTPMGGWRLQQKNRFKVSNLLSIPPSGYLYFYRKHFSSFECFAFVLGVILRGYPHFAKYRIKSFLKTPFRVLGAVKAWRESTRLLKKGPVFLDATPNFDDVKLLLPSNNE